MKPRLADPVQEPRQVAGVHYMSSWSAGCTSGTCAKDRSNPPLADVADAFERPAD